MNYNAPTKPLYPKQYLGDGVYVSHDGYHIILSLDAQDPVNPIALEPGLLQKIVQYEKDVIKYYKERS
jgi:hypothetical protein